MADPDDSPPPSPPEETHEKKKHKSKQPKPKTFTISSSSTSAAAVGYFPSGYDPTAASPESAPRATLVQNEQHASRVELVVAPHGSESDGVRFVGRSYAGEGAVPQVCGYALGVLDKTAGTLRIVPIAGNKVLRMEPQFRVNQQAHTQQSETLTTELGSPTKSNRKIQDLTNLYGTKKDRDRDDKWRALNEQRNDPTAYELEYIEMPEASRNNEENTTESTARNIPPYDPSADTAERAYLLDEIISKGERAHLLEILEHLDSEEGFASKNYPRFVRDRVHKLLEIQDWQEKEKLAWILSYITHLVSFWEQKSSPKHKSKHHQSHSTVRPKIPDTVYRKLFQNFMDQGAQALSSEKKNLLIGYILVLSLFADDFRSDPTDICMDLKMTFPEVKIFYLELGCKFQKGSASKPSVATLPVPLKFPDMRKKRRRTR